MNDKQMIAFAGEGSFAESLRAYLQRHQEVEVCSFSDVLNGKVDIVDLVIEATNSGLEQKKKNLEVIEEHLSTKTLILSTVLGLTATQAASWLQVPNRLVGFASFAPFEARNLIEITAALQTGRSYVEEASCFFQRLDKQVEQVEDEVGLVFPRILSLIINEAAFTLMQGTAKAEDIDTAMIYGTNYPLGPLAWADEIGLDDVYAVLTGLQRELGEERYRPASLIRKMIYAGYLGKQTGQGFYHHVKE